MATDTTPAPSAVASSPALHPAGPFPYDYSQAVYELSFEAILQGQPGYTAWRELFLPKYRALVSEIPLPPIEAVHLGDANATVEGASYVLHEVALPMRNGTLPYGGLLAVPRTVHPERPVVLALHGHEEYAWGRLPYSNFLEHRWMHALAEAGYVVFAPISMYHKEIADIAEQYSYPLTWTRLASDTLDAIADPVLAAIPHQGLAVAGLSAGGTIGYCLMAYRQDISRGVFAGALQSLEFLRREYRIAGHPNCWDIPQLRSYSAIQALIAPRPVMFQMGRQDPFFAGPAPMQATSAFSGSTRPVMATEIAADIAVLKRIWRVHDGVAENTLCLRLHEGGHVLEPDTAMLFLQDTREMCD
ncbi:dienelactone hydrolase family protein [Megalodesulfovibrio paquesii]